MLAHLTRRRLLRGNFRTGSLHYESTQLRWSGANAAGDEYEGPVCMVIDVGRDFTMSFDRKLYVPATGQTFTPWRLYQQAYLERFGMKLLWDEQAEAPRKGDPANA